MIRSIFFRSSSAFFSSSHTRFWLLMSTGCHDFLRLRSPPIVPVRLRRDQRLSRCRVQCCFQQQMNAVVAIFDRAREVVKQFMEAKNGASCEVLDVDKADRQPRTYNSLLLALFTNCGLCLQRCNKQATVDKYSGRAPLRGSDSCNNIQSLHVAVGSRKSQMSMDVETPPYES